jgi:hypothetical protein
MQRSLSSVLFPEYRRRVLGFLLLRPDDPFLRGVLDHESLFLIGNHHDLAKLAGESVVGDAGSLM